VPSIEDPRVQPALEAMILGDAGALHAAIDADPGVVAVRWGENTLLEWVTQPPHGIADDIVGVLIERGSSLDRALNLAACWNLADVCARLLEAGADPGARADAGITPLESAAMHGSTQAADVLAPHGLHRRSLWLAAASGLLEEVRSWVAPSGDLLRPPGPYRPNWADVGRPSGTPPSDDPVEIIGEAFVLAAANERIDVAEYLRSAGADIDARPYRNTTALHLAIQFAKPGAVRYLLANGAATDILDDNHHGDAAGWAAACQSDDPSSRLVTELIRAASPPPAD
jgi:ankyrin repeat protein